jgi:hypothetical protein
VTAVHVTMHACQRYVERIDGRLTIEEARAEIQGHACAISTAAAFGARIVKTSRAKLVLQGARVVTVLDRHWLVNSDVMALS